MIYGEKCSWKDHRPSGSSLGHAHLSIFPLTKILKKYSLPVLELFVIFVEPSHTPLWPRFRCRRQRESWGTPGSLGSACACGTWPRYLVLTPVLWSVYPAHSRRWSKCRGWFSVRGLRFCDTELPSRLSRPSGERKTQIVSNMWWWRWSSVDSMRTDILRELRFYSPPFLTFIILPFLLFLFK